MGGRVCVTWAVGATSRGTITRLNFRGIADSNGFTENTGSGR